MDKQFTNVDMPAILAGTGVALAISIVLLHFGAAVGLSMSPDTVWEQDTVVGKVIAMNLWVMWAQILSALIGGYIAGRLRTPVPGSDPHEREMRDGMHGVAVWGFGTVAVAIGVAVIAAITAISPDAAEVSAQAERNADVLRMNESVAIISAFSMASISLVAAVASWFAASKGGDHRDEGTDLSRIVSFRK